MGTSSTQSMQSVPRTFDASMPSHDTSKVKKPLSSLPYGHKITPLELPLQAGDTNKVGEIKGKVLNSGSQNSTTEIQHKHRCWIWVPFVACAVAVKVVAYAIFKVFRAIFRFLFVNKVIIEYQDKAPPSKLKRSRSESSLSMTSTERYYAPNRPLDNPKPTLESLIPDTHAYEVVVVNGLKRSAFMAERYKTVPQDVVTPVPLRNIGNSCYFNSFIYQLDGSTLVDDIRRPIVRKPNMDQEQFSLLNAYQNAWVRFFDVLDYIRFAKATHAHDPNQLAQVLEGEVWRLRNILFTGQEKQDTHLATLHEKYPFHYELAFQTITAQQDTASLFEGLFNLLNICIHSVRERRMRYQDRHYVKPTNETLTPFIPCGVPRSGLTLQKLVEKDFVERVDDPRNAYRLELNDGVSVNVTSYTNRTQLTGEPPKALALQLKRFADMGAKNINSIVLPENEILELKDIFAGQQNVRYRITGCVKHEGSSIQSGHYTSFVKRGSNWFDCNDSIVTPTTWKNVQDRSQSIYIINLELLDIAHAATGA